MGSEQPSQFTAQVLAESGRGNQTAFLLAGVAYAKSRGEGIEEWARFVGERFVPTWGERRTDSAVEVAKDVARNIAAEEDGRVDEVSGDERRALVRAEWTTDESLRLFGVSRDEVDMSTEIFRPIAAHLGLELTWSRDPQGLRVELSRAS